MKRRLILLAAGAAIALPACGGDQPGPGSAGRALPAATVDAATIAEAHKRGYLNESSPPGAKAARGGPARRPCDLVSAAEASAAFGTAVRKPVEGRQGPTCIYRTRSGKGFLSLAVQTSGTAQLKPLLAKSRPVTVSGRKGYCGPEATLHVPLAGGRLLSVGGVPARRVPASTPRCNLARDFAAKALVQLAR